MRRPRESSPPRSCAWTGPTRHGSRKHTSPPSGRSPPGRDPDDLAALASFDLEREGVLSSEALLTDVADEAWARDFTGEFGDGNFDHTVITPMRQQPDGSFRPERPVPAPWHDEDEPDGPIPFVYHAREGYAPTGAFADLASRDPLLRGPNAPELGILAVGRAMPDSDDLEVDSLPAQVALHTSKDWYASTHPVALHRDAGGRASPSPCTSTRTTPRIRRTSGGTSRTWTYGSSSRTPPARPRPPPPRSSTRRPRTLPAPDLPPPSPGRSRPRPDGRTPRRRASGPGSPRGIPSPARARSPAPSRAA